MFDPRVRLCFALYGRGLSDLSPTPPPLSFNLSHRFLFFLFFSRKQTQFLLLLSSDEDEDEEDDDEDDDDDEALRVLLPRFVVGRVLRFLAGGTTFVSGVDSTGKKRWRNKRKRNEK